VDKPAELQGLPIRLKMLAEGIKCQQPAMEGIET